jgi:hypothetical protein
MPTSNNTTLITGLAAAAAGSLVTAIFMNKCNKTTRFPATQQTREDAETILYPDYDYENDPKRSFVKMCDYLIEEIKEELPRHYDLPPRETSWIIDMLNYNVKGGKMNRGLMVVDAGVLMLGGAKNVDNTTLPQLVILG